MEVNWVVNLGCEIGLCTKGFKPFVHAHRKKKKVKLAILYD